MMVIWVTNVNRLILRNVVIVLGSVGLLCVKGQRLVRLRWEF
jgi:hypothetical protein